MAWESDEIDGDLAVWPAFVDLLAATALVLVAFLAVVLVAVEAGRGGEIKTQKAALEQALKKPEIGFGIVFDVDTDDVLIVRLSLREEATFPKGVYQWDSLRSQARESLRKIGEELKRTEINPLYREIRVVGHSDQDAYAPGANYSNWELSASRAAVVARFLVDEVGVDPCRVNAIGLGPYYPKEEPAAVDSPPTEDQKRQNRRIELQFIPTAFVTGAPSEWTGSCYPTGDGSRSRATVPVEAAGIALPRLQEPLGR